MEILYNQDIHVFQDISLLHLLHHLYLIQQVVYLVQEHLHVHLQLVLLQVILLLKEA